MVALSLPFLFGIFYLFFKEFNVKIGTIHGESFYVMEKKNGSEDHWHYKHTQEKNIWNKKFIKKIKICDFYLLFVLFFCFRSLMKKQRHWLWILLHDQTKLIF